MSPRWLTILIGLLLAGLAALTPATTLAATDDEIAAAAHFRASIGFQHEEAFVRTTFTNTEDYPNDDWGVPLSKAEAAEMERRTRARLTYQDAIDYAVEQPGSAGVYIDQLHGGRPVFLFTTDVAEQKETLGRMLPAGTEYVVSKVDHDTRTLRAMQDRIVDQWDALEKDGIPVEMVAIDVIANTVLVSLRHETAGAKASLRSAYDFPIETEVIGALQADCSSRKQCRDPLKGGLRVHPKDYSDDMDCTSAGLGKKDGSFVIIVAGHCITSNSGGVGNVWQHGYPQLDRFGVAQGKSLPNGGGEADVDVGWIDVDSGEDVSPANQFFRDGHTDIKSFTHLAANNEQQVHDTVCRSGITTQWTCGLILIAGTADTRPTDNNGTWEIKHVWVVDFDAQGGDSGAPYTKIYGYDPVSGNPLWAIAGVHSHSGNDQCDPDTNCRAWYSSAQRIENKVDGLTFCTSSGC
jgi:hypothetical protein